MCICFKSFPFLRMTFYLVIHIPIRCSEIIPPIVLIMPVRFWKISACHKPFLSEGFEYILGNIRFRMLLKSTPGYGKIRVLTIEHTKAVMMFSRKNHVFHTGLFRHFRPLGRFEFSRIELLTQSVPIPILKLLIVIVTVTTDPVHIFGTQSPRFNNTRHGIKSPVKNNTELQITPLVQFLQYERVFRPFVGRWLFMYKCVLSSHSCGEQAKCHNK